MSSAIFSNVKHWDLCVVTAMYAVVKNNFVCEHEVFSSFQCKLDNKNLSVRNYPW